MNFKKLVGRSLATLAVTAVAVLVGYGYRATVRVRSTYEPFPTEEQLSSLTGGRYFRGRPSDGGSLEYYLYGANHTQSDDDYVEMEKNSGGRRRPVRTWLFVHGAVSTGGMPRIFPGFDERMKALGVRVIAPTMPGWGASDPYDPLFEIDGAEWLDRFSRDTLALLDQLGVATFSVSGMSLGGTPGLAVAAAACRDGRLEALAPLIALTWNHPGFDIETEGGFTLRERAPMALLRNRFGASFAAETLRAMVLGASDKQWEANPMIPADVAWNRIAWGHDMQHSMRYQVAGQVQSNRLAGYGTAGPLVDWSVFRESVPVHVFYGERDTVVPPAIATFAARKLPWAKLRPFNGTHFHLDIFEVADTLFGGGQEARE